MISLSRLRDALGTKPEDDPKVELIRAEVIAQWDSATNRSWQLETVVEKFYPECTNYIYLNKFPVTGITLVRERVKTSTTWTTIPSTAYIQMDSNGLEKITGNFSEVVEVSYSGGYSETTAPAEIVKALETQARFLSERLSDAKIIVKSQNFEGGGGVLEDAEQHPFFKKIAKRYIRRV